MQLTKNTASVDVLRYSQNVIKRGCSPEFANFCNSEQFILYLAEKELSNSIRVRANFNRQMNNANATSKY